MRRLLTFAAFLLIVSLPSYAQHGGSHGGFSGGHSMSGGHSGFSGHAVSGPAFGGSHVSSFSGSHFGSGSHSFSNNHTFTHTTVRTWSYPYGYGRRCYGCSGFGYGYPYYYGYLDPYWWWDTYPSSNSDYASDREQAYAMNQQNLEEQQMLRQQDQDAYARPAAPAHQEQTAENDPPTVLVFRDQHQREIHNYAIADGILWNFMSTRTEKIPLAVIDIPATVKANDDRGVEFRLPGTGEGQ